MLKHTLLALTAFLAGWPMVSMSESDIGLEIGSSVFIDNQDQAIYLGPLNGYNLFMHVPDGGSSMSHEDALNGCSGMNPAWALGTLDELRSLYKLRGKIDLISLGIHPVNSNWYWTRTLHSEGKAYRFRFSDGQFTATPTRFFGRTLCMIRMN